MRYVFYNMAGCQIWETTSGVVELSKVWNPDMPTTSAIRLLFSNMGPPPEDAIARVGIAHDGTERWSVGPFDILVQIVEE